MLRTTVMKGEKGGQVFKAEKIELITHLLADRKPERKKPPKPEVYIRSYSLTTETKRLSY
jgi:hypothetical protein